MGNCQAVDTAMLVVQHPSGKEDKLYCFVPASEIMKSNPNHYVALLVTSRLCPSGDRDGDGGGQTGSKDNGLVRVTRIKVLRPTDTLVPGHVYRLITAQEVVKVMRAKQRAKMMKKRNQSESGEGGTGNVQPSISGFESTARKFKRDETIQETKHGRHHSKSPVSVATAASVKARTWQPSLQRISEVGS